MASNGRSLYLHFLDRELGESVATKVSSHNAQISLQLISVFSECKLSCGASLLHESPAIELSSSLLDLVMLLIETEQLSILSSHPTMDEFIESRSQLYMHDKLRYPMYFGNRLRFPQGIKILPKHASATEDLAQKLLLWSAQTSGLSPRESDARKVVLESLARREGRAVTAALFSAATAHSSNPIGAINSIRRQISKEYTTHFMEVLGSDIPTGIRGIEYFDTCSRGYPQFDIPILTAVSESLGARIITEEAFSKERNFWHDLLHARGQDPKFADFSRNFSVFRSSLLYLYETGSKVSRDSFRIHIQQTLARAGSQYKFSEVKLGDTFFPLLTRRLANIVELLKNSPEYKEASRKAEADSAMKDEYKFLLMVATEIEREAVFKKIAEVGNEIRPVFSSNRGYYDLGYINGNRVALVKVEMGSGTVGGSVTTTMQIKDLIKPKYIIMVGIAFGMNQKKQEIGNVLIGRQVLSYESQRVGGTAEEEDIKLRGDRTSASPALVSLLQTAAGVWSEAKVETGLLLSGDKLVDNVAFREKLEAISGGQAIGGEMEGSGLMIAAAESSMQWVVVKAICDWADGNKSYRKADRQRLAADNAVSLVFRALDFASPDNE